MFEVIYQVGFWFFIVVLTIANFLFCTYQYHKSKEEDKVGWVVVFGIFSCLVVLSSLLWHVAIPLLLSIAIFTCVWRLFTDKVHPTIEKLLKEKINA